LAARSGSARPVAFARIGIVGLDGRIELEAIRLYGLPGAAPALLCRTPTLPVGQREFAAEMTLDLPSLAAGAVHLAGVTVPGARQGDRAEPRRPSIAWPGAILLRLRTRCCRRRRNAP
jgi:hypothetical protein